MDKCKQDGKIILVNIIIPMLVNKRVIHDDILRIAADHKKYEVCLEVVDWHASDYQFQPYGSVGFWRDRFIESN